MIKGVLEPRIILFPGAGSSISVPIAQPPFPSLAHISLPPQIISGTGRGPILTGVRFFAPTASALLQSGSEGGGSVVHLSGRFGSKGLGGSGNGGNGMGDDGADQIVEQAFHIMNNPTGLASKIAPLVLSWASSFTDTVMDDAFSHKVEESLVPFGAPLLASIRTVMHRVSPHQGMFLMHRMGVLPKGTVATRVKEAYLATASVRQLTGDESDAALAIIEDIMVKFSDNCNISLGRSASRGEMTTFRDQLMNERLLFLNVAHMMTRGNIAMLSSTFGWINPHK
ncbi:MAG: hypothetical protein HN337_01215 [Deltaproteobacteria bacterium]|jgi:hypothetical protein|nr:hypothetical protein [Deltaproteobacteria bacterium]